MTYLYVLQFGKIFIYNYITMVIKNTFKLSAFSTHTYLLNNWWFKKTFSHIQEEFK